MKKHLVAALAAMGFASGAHAITVETAGTVQNACVFTSNSPGEFGSNAIDPTKLSTSHVGGTGAEVQFSYTGQPTLAITGPSAFDLAPELGSIVPVFTSLGSSVAKGSLTFTDGSASTQYTTGSSDTINLGVLVSTGSETNFPAGEYAVSQTLTCS